MTEHTPRQLWAFTFVAFTAPAAVICAGLPWYWVLLASVLSTVLLLWLQRLYHARAVGTLAQTVASSLGKPALLLTALYLVLAMRRMGELADTAFPDNAPSAFLPLTMLAVCAWGCASSKEAVFRAVCVTFFFVLTAYGIILILALPSLRFPLHLPDTFEPPLLGTLTLPFLALYLAPKPTLNQTENPSRLRNTKASRLFPLLFALYPPVLSFFTAAVPGSNHSFYTLTTTLRLSTASHRIEPVVSCIFTLGWFSALCIHALTVGEIFSALGWSRKAGVLTACLLCASCVLGDLLLPPILYASCATLFCALIPAIALLVAPRKKD